jgi:hypothetical protein
VANGSVTEAMHMTKGWPSVQRALWQQELPFKTM